MAVKRYVCYPRSNKADMVALTPELLASTAYYDDFRKYVREEDYAALEAKAYKAGTVAGELQMRVNQLEAECERLREELNKGTINKCRIEI